LQAFREIFLDKTRILCSSFTIAIDNQYSLPLVTKSNLLIILIENGKNTGKTPAHLRKPLFFFQKGENWHLGITLTERFEV
jgi:hypothetical protein